MKKLSSKKNIYFENLDALRFLCFLVVFFYHSFHTQSESLKSSVIYILVKNNLFVNGNLGVNFFFVLSGFLITYLLIEEKKINSQISLRQFWVRRVLRIWPLFYLSVFFGFYIFPLLKTLFGQTPNETASVWFYITFLNNFDFISKGLPDASILGVLWSVAIEEQFYFIWPIILYLLPINRYWIAFSSVIIISWVFRACNDTPLVHEYHTLSCIGDMAIGAMGAWLIQVNAKFKLLFKQLKKPYILATYVLFLLIFFFREYLQQTYHIRIFERSLIAGVMLIIILEQNYSKRSFFKLSQFKKMSRLGIISYGLYSLHFVGILVTTTILKKLGLDQNLWEILILQTAIALTITIIISHVSYKYYEKPFLTFKKKFTIIGTSKKGN